MFASALFVLYIYNLVPLVAAQVQFLGVNIAGGDFGCGIDGTCPISSAQLPLSSLGGGDGAGQMQHFVQNDRMNMFRLPISWQYLVNNQLGGDLDATNLANYNQLVQTCLSTGAYCIVEIHNYARWNGAIIGQGGPTDDQFAALWTALATQYANSSKVIFELMNEPHDLDITLWAATCQKAVTAIRNAGAAEQMILLPGTNFDSAATLATDGSAAALMTNITNPDGSTSNLLLDVHKYLDTDNSGTHETCTTNNTAAFQSVADFLRAQKGSGGRRAIVTETGASDDSSCLTNFCEQNAFLNANADVFVGIVGWAAGSFNTSYLLSLTPSSNSSGYEDSALLSQCLVGTWQNATNGTSGNASSSAEPTTTLASTVVSRTASISSSSSSPASQSPVPRTPTTPSASSSSTLDLALTTTFTHTTPSADAAADADTTDSFPELTESGTLVISFPTAVAGGGTADGDGDADGDIMMSTLLLASGTVGAGDGPESAVARPTAVASASATTTTHTSGAGASGGRFGMVRVGGVLVGSLVAGFVLL